MPGPLEGVLERMVAKERQERFCDPAAMAAALRPSARGRIYRPCSGRKETIWERIIRSPTRSRRDRAARPPRRLLRIARAAVLGALLLVAALAAWGTWKATGGQPAVCVEKAVLFVRRHGDDLTIQKLVLEAGAGKGRPELDPLTADDDFKLHAEFNRPTHWYLVWIDTVGAVQVVAHSQQPERVAEYPAGNNLIGVNRQDPAGTHLLLLLAGDRNPQEVQDQLRQRLQDVGTPPTVPYPQDVQVRAPGPSR